MIFSTLIVAGIALLLGAALTEMCVAHPAAGSFGLYAEMYLSTFAGYAVNREPFLRVMQMHRDAAERINEAGPQYLRDAARGLWDRVLTEDRKHGFRNAQATVLAPTAPFDVTAEAVAQDTGSETLARCGVRHDGTFLCDVVTRMKPSESVGVPTRQHR